MKAYTKVYIQSLIDKFLDGQTSPEEERLLAEYFRTEAVPPEWEDYREMFAWFDGGMRGKYLQDDAGGAELSADAAGKSSAPSTPSASAESGIAASPRRSRLVRLALPWLAAACLAGGLVWGLWPSHDAGQRLTATTATAPRRAAHETSVPSAAPSVVAATDATTKSGNVAPTTVPARRMPVAHAAAPSHGETHGSVPTDEAVTVGQADSLLLAEARERLAQCQAMGDSVVASHALLLASMMETKAMVAEAKRDIAQAKLLIDSYDKQHVSPNNIIEL